MGWQKQDVESYRWRLILAAGNGSISGCLKKDQNSFGLDGRDLLREIKNFSRLSLNNFFDVRRRFLYLSKSTGDLDLWSLRHSVSFFLIIDKISPVTHGGLYLPLIVFLGVHLSSIASKVSLHKFQF